MKKIVLVLMSAVASVTLLASCASQATQQPAASQPTPAPACKHHCHHDYKGETK